MAANLTFLKEAKNYVKTLPTKGLNQTDVMEKIKEYSTLGMAVSVQWYMSNCFMVGNLFKESGNN